MHLDLITQIYNTKINDQLLQSHMDQLIEKHHATRVVNTLMPVLEGEKYGILDGIRQDVDDYVEIYKTTLLDAVKQGKKVRV